MQSKLGAMVRNLADLYPLVRIGALRATVAVAACFPGIDALAANPESPPTQAAQDKSSAPAAAYRDGLEKIAKIAFESGDLPAQTKKMREVAKSVLLAAKTRGFDVDSSADPEMATTAFYRNRLRGALYVNTNGMTDAQAAARVHGIAVDALNAKQPASATPVRAQPASAAPVHAQPEQAVSAHETGGYPIKASVFAADVSQPVTPAFLSKMREMKVGTIIRYYDHLDETIKGKTLHRKERDLIVGSGFDIAVVFQHHNGDLTSFTPERGRRDAERSLELADENLQPKNKGRMIYFGVDNDFVRPGEVEKVTAYFVEVNKALRDKGYEVGAYGSGATCKHLMQHGLAKNCWLAQSSGYAGYHEFMGSKKWAMAQMAQERVSGLDVDLDKVNEDRADFGQFGR